MDAFKYDERLGIEVPRLDVDWELLTRQEQEEIIEKWEHIRASIPDRIKELELVINERQHQLDQEEDFTICCALNSEISELASIINDLHLWYRMEPSLSSV